MNRLMKYALAMTILTAPLQVAQAQVCEMEYMKVSLHVKTDADAQKLLAWAKENNLNITQSERYPTTFEMSGKIAPDEANAMVKKGNKEKTYQGVALPADIGVQNWSASGPCKKQG